MPGAMIGKMVKKSKKSAVIGTSVPKKILSFFKERDDVSLVFVFGSFVRSEMTASPRKVWAFQIL